MDPREFCRQSRVIIVAGKGGVGKTMISAAMARMAARAGMSVLALEVGAQSGLAALFGVDGSEEGRGGGEVVLHPGNTTAPQPEGSVRARSLRPDDALREYLEGHGLARLSRRLIRGGVLEMAATAAPGIKDILVLGKVKQLERSGAADLIVVDAPASGHAVTFLTSASRLLEVVRSGPLRTQAEEVLALLSDPARCQVVLVTLAEETPVNEVTATAFALEDSAGVTLGPLVVNGLYQPPGPGRADALGSDPQSAAAARHVQLAPGEAEALAEAARFRRIRSHLQQQQTDRLARSLPLPQLHLPWLFTVEPGAAEVDLLAGYLSAEIRAKL